MYKNITLEMRIVFIYAIYPRKPMYISIYKKSDVLYISY